MRTTLVIVDTSVWVGALRRPDARVSQTLARLLVADEVRLPVPARIGIVGRLLGQSARARPTRTLSSAGPPAHRQHLGRGGEMDRADGRGGYRFAIADLLIAAPSQEFRALVWSRDADFERLASLRFVWLYSAAELTPKHSRPLPNAHFIGE